jgi:hypothetical protein
LADACPPRDPPDARRRSLVWLHERGGEGLVDQWGRVVARGQAAPQGWFGNWLRLVADGHLCGSGGRLRLSEAGCAAAASEADLEPRGFRSLGRAR